MIEILFKEREWKISLTFVKTLSIITFTALTTLGAYIYIPLPFTPVPITLQVFFVLLSGLYLGSFNGFLSQFLYILLGILGLPVFARANAGINVLLGPTGGYLIAFPFASFIMGKFLNPPFKKLNVLIISLISLLIIYTFGVIGLSIFFSFKKPFHSLLIMGVLPFIPGDILKIMFILFFSFYAKRFREIFLEIESAGEEFES